MSQESSGGSLSGHDLRWERHNSERQTRIIESAVALIDENPVGTEIPVQVIAKRAGLAKSVVYRQFEGREDLDRRIRSYLMEDFVATLSAQLDVTNGSVDDILTRAVGAVLDWMIEHPHRYDFMGAGPVAGDEVELDAISTVKLRVEQQARSILIPITEVLGIEWSPFETLAYALVTMVEGTLTRWSREHEHEKTRDEIVSDLAAYAWYLLDEAGRAAGVSLDPQAPLMATLAQVSGARNQRASRV